MKRFFRVFLIAVLSLTLAVSSMLPAFASEAGTTAKTEEGVTNTGTGDVDSDGALSAADARALAKEAQSGEISAEQGDYNMDGKVDLADAKILLRAAAGTEPTASLDLSDPLSKNGLGVNDRILFANGSSFSAAEYSYYYSALYMSYAQQAYYYDYYYGEGYGAMLTGFDYRVSPEEQYLSAADGSQISYAEYFRELTVATMEQYSYYADQAKAMGLTLTEDDLALVKENLASIDEAAASYGVSTDEFLLQQYGEGINSYVLSEVIKDQLFAQKYQDKISEDLAQKITDEEIEAVYNEDPEEYNRVTLRAMRFSISQNEDGSSDAEQQQAAAADFMSKVTDEASFVKIAAETDPENFSEDINSLVEDADYNTISQNIGEDAADWAFSSDRKTGDMQIFSTGMYVYVLFVCEPAARNEEHLPSVRHILVTFDDSEEVTSEEGVTNLSGERVLSKAEAYKLCEDYLKEFKRGDRTEESFAALAEKYSEDTASLSSGGQGGEGGLYTQIPRGQYVKPFEDWAYDESRQVGDTGIVETEYGYHIMYFCGREDEPEWKATIRAELASEETEEYLSDLDEKYAGMAVYSSEDTDAAYDFAMQSISGYFA